MAYLLTCRGLAPHMHVWTSSPGPGRRDTPLALFPFFLQISWWHNTDRVRVPASKMERLDVRVNRTLPFELIALQIVKRWKQQWSSSNFLFRNQTHRQSGGSAGGLRLGLHAEEKTSMFHISYVHLRIWNQISYVHLSSHSSYPKSISTVNFTWNYERSFVLQDHWVALQKRDFLEQKIVRNGTSESSFQLRTWT